MAIHSSYAIHGENLPLKISTLPPPLESTLPSGSLPPSVMMDIASSAKKFLDYLGLLGDL